MALIVHQRGMSNETALYFATAIKLAGVNSFYKRRVIQRCDRGEISLRDAAELLIAAAQRGEARTVLVSVRADGT